MAVGFCKVDVLPFPKSHAQEVGPPVDWSVKFTIRGEQPACGEPVKLATGFCPNTAVVPAKNITNTATSFVGVLFSFVHKMPNFKIPFQER